MTFMQAERLTALDLRGLSEAEHAALRQAAIAAEISLSSYLAELIAEKSRRILSNESARQLETSDA